MIPVVAVNVVETDRELLMEIAGQHQMEVRFASSAGGAWTDVTALEAPIVLVDRDLGCADWRSVVRLLSSAEQRPCVVLASKVIDNYLRHEVIRCGGYDVLAKPIKREDLARLLRRAWSYWCAVASPRSERASR